MITLPPPESQSSASNPWLQQSVQVFFSAINWEDHPPEVQEIKRTSLHDSTASLSLSLSVCQFFAAIDWDDVAIAAPTTVAESPASPLANTLTLDDFSDLF